jgi:hypothetical protein
LFGGPPLEDSDCPADINSRSSHNPSTVLAENHFFRSLGAARIERRNLHFTASTAIRKRFCDHDSCKLRF